MIRFLTSLIIFVFIAVVTSISGYGQIQPSVSTSIKTPVVIRSAGPIKGASGYYGYNPDTTQVSQYIRRIVQDKEGNLWFGTVGDGVCRYDGKSLRYYSVLDGFSGNSVQGIVVDREGNLWFGTDGGISKYDGSKFTHFTEKDGLPANHVSSLLIDSTGIIWIGTDQGVCRFDGKIVTPFPIPAAVEKDLLRGSSPKIIWNMMEDKAGNIWFATNGGGIYRYDGKNLTNISKKDGLTSNFVNCILQDKTGNLWFATQHKGVSRYDGNSFTHFTDKEGLAGNEVYTLYEDKAGNLWLSAWGSVSRYDGQSFATFTTQDGLTNCCVQSIYEDTSGNLWFGSGAGLFRFDGKSFTNVAKKGPWPQKFR